jgi:uncharacterized membrane protein/thiol-disulfide isomerase/thioredoxin
LSILVGAILIISFLAIISFCLQNNLLPAVFFSFLLLLKLAGILITSLLLWYEVDKFNPGVQKICKGAGAKVNCNAVLNSQGAKLFSFASWSEMGFFYFAGGFLALSLQPNQGLIHIIALANLLTLPYVCFSLYYQWKIVRHWCPLCLAVQSIFFIEFLNNCFSGTLSFTNISSAFTFSNTGLLLITFIIPLMFWYFIKPHLLKGKKGRDYKYELARLKANPDIFESLLQGQKKIVQNTDGLGVILGNPSGANTIIQICNPYCGPCARAHLEIDKLLHENNDLKVQIIFTASANKNDITAQPVRHFLAINEKADTKLIEKALDDWYLTEEKDYNKFAAKYPLNGEISHQDQKLSLMHKWCNEVGIQFTPTFFFNGYQLPEIYNLSDLRYFLNAQPCL